MRSLWVGSDRRLAEWSEILHCGESADIVAVLACKIPELRLVVWRCSKTVFRVLDHHVEPSQVAKVHDALPAAARAL
jgi:uncharacterized protein (DUF2267 family)